MGLKKLLSRNSGGKVMCGVYAIFQTKDLIDQRQVAHLARTAQVRGSDSAGVVYRAADSIIIKKRDCGSAALVRGTQRYKSRLLSQGTAG